MRFFIALMIAMVCSQISFAQCTTPTITASGPTTFCQGGSVVLTSSTAAGLTYQWKLNGTNIPNATSSSYTTNAGGSYTVTISDGSVPCSAISTPTVVTVNPTATIASSSLTICSGASFSITPQNGGGNSIPIDTQYSWTVANDSVSGELNSSSSQSNIGQTLVNSTSNNQLVVYTVSPQTGTCLGSPFSISVTVSSHAIPNVTDPADQSICAGSPSTSINFVSPLNISGTIFSWTNSNPSIGLSQSNGTGNINSFTSTNSTNTAINSTIIVTPSYTVSGLTCTGEPQTFSITVKPLPVMTSAAALSICSGVTVSLPLTSNISSTFAWQALSNSNVGGESTSVQSTSTINNTLSNATTSDQIVSYNVIPTANGCPGPSQSVSITVKPLPSMTSPISANICSGANPLSFSLTSNISSTYTWQAASNNNVGGESTSVQTTSAINNTLINSTLIDQIVVYTVIPTANGCPGASQTVSITVKPLPSMTGETVSNICSGGTLNFPLTSNLSSSYTWQAAPNSNVGGESLSNQSTSVINNTLINLTLVDHVVVYTVTPTSNGCPGSQQSVSITVKPRPSITSASVTSICSGSPVNFQLTSNITSTYTWLATSNSNVAGESLSVQNTSIINNTLAHSFNSNQIVDYTVTPTSNGCDGQSQIVSITVKPRPSIISNLQQTICSEQQFTFTPQNGNNGIVPANTTLTWTVSSSNVNGGINNTTAGVNSIIQTLTNTNYANNQVVYTVTPEASLCAGNSFDYTVTVNKAPNLIVTSTSSICEGNTIQLFAVDAFNSGQLFYNWTNSSTLNNPNIFNPIASPTVNTLYSFSVTDNTTQCQITRSVTVNVSPLPAATATYTGSSSVCQGSSLLLSANAGNDLTYQWKLNDVSLSGQTNSTYAATIAGVYTVVVTNSSGCSKTSQGVSVSVNPLPVADISNLSTTSFCEGQSVFLNTTNVIGNTYIWRLNGNIIPNATASGFNAAASGNYNVTVLNSATQCSNTSPALVITVNPLPTASINPQGGTVCQGGSVTLNATSGSGLSYQWKLNDIAIPGATGSAFNAITSGIYTVVVTNSNGCSKTSNGQTVIVNPLPISDVSNLSTTTFCQGESVIFNTTNVAGNTYQWKLNGIDIPGADLYSYEAEGAGSYSVQVTNANSCSALSPAIDVLVNPLPIVNISALDSVLCFGESTVLLASGTSTYSWTPASVVSNSSTANPSAFPTSTTNFGVTGTDLNGCSTYSEIQITVVPNPTLDLPSSIEACQGSTVSLPGSALIAWTGVTSTNDFDAEQSGYAVATLQNSNLCSSTDSIYIQVNLLPVPNISGASSVCANASYSEYVVNSTGNLFSWNVSNGELQGVDNGNTAIVHWFDQEYGPSTFVTITEHDIHSGCEGSDTLFVSFAGVAPNTTIVSLLYPNGSTLFCADHYAIMNWGSTIISNNVDEYTDGHAQYYTFDNFDTALRYYWIEAGDDSLCLTRSYFNAPVWQVSVQETTDNSLSKIYPNPTSGILNLSIDAKNSISSFSIYNVTGRLVKQEYNFKNQSVIDVSDLPSGCYILKANDGKGSNYNQTFIKQ